MGHNLVPAAKTAIFYNGHKSEQLGGREPIVAAGGVLGGGSSINFMMYTRPQRCDLDSWNMPGWSANELLPYLKKVSKSLLSLELWLTGFSSKHIMETVTLPSTAMMARFTYQMVVFDA